MASLSACVFTSHVKLVFMLPSVTSADFVLAMFYIQPRTRGKNRTVTIYKG